MSWRHACSAGVLALLSACSTVPLEKGKFWCNEPLPFPSGRPFGDIHFDVARRGYVYALAAALTLQDDSPESKDHWFSDLPRMKRVHREEHWWSGFEVHTYALRDKPEDAEPYECIVAFAGSNDWRDWVFANVGFSLAQHTRAASYLEGLSENVPECADKRIVVAGFSLGAALAGYVTYNERTSAIVSEAWLFNPSPKLARDENLPTSDRPNPKLWVAAQKGELLQAARSWPIERILPSATKIPAPPNQNAQDYYLIEAFPIYAHYRYALTRQLLIAADYAHLRDKMGPLDERRRLEPREIIESSYFAACDHQHPVPHRRIWPENSP